MCGRSGFKSLAGARSHERTCRGDGTAEHGRETPAAAEEETEEEEESANVEDEWTCRECTYANALFKRNGERVVACAMCGAC